MTKINPIQMNNKIKNLKNMEKFEENLETSTKKIIKDLLTRAEREVPEYGSFKLVYEEFKNPDNQLNATDFMLKISKPQGASDEKLRFLEAVAYDLPKPYISERVMASGNKDEILKALKNENFAQELISTFKELSKNLEDI